ncbi:hypothetical protein [Achromobacter sp. Root565]|uniref:hypothetical protein n=1 Tax=Achromobacter sp. Root565 TaxID=1736564 RepID=UPI0006FEDF9B|nr:hypothetical protein [Achromobacter sp. Root565]KQZ96145.1 hypothetical protein ASD71_26135 [Achromobacter sp. Root565]
MNACAIPQSPWPPEAQAGFKYVGFIDILGFSNRVLANSETVINEYQEFCELLLDGDIDQSVELTVYSDAIMLVSDKLAALAHFAQAVCFFALNRNLVVRGGISYGRFWSKSHARGLMVVSEALVRAVQMEKEIGHPAVVFDETIAFPDPFWAEHLADREHTVSRPVIHFDGLNMINPFNTFWFRTARTRVLGRLEEATRPQHRAKYEWFLSLWTAMNEFEPMTPVGVDERLMATGILERIPLDDTAPVRSYRIPPDEL